MEYYSEWADRLSSLWCPRPHSGRQYSGKMLVLLWDPTVTSPSQVTARKGQDPQQVHIHIQHESCKSLEPNLPVKKGGPESATPGKDDVGSVDESAKAETSLHACDDPMFRLLQIMTDGVVESKIHEACEILRNDKLTANDKLNKIDHRIRIPPTASGSDLGRMLRVSKTAVYKTDWWRQNRRGQKQNQIGRRESMHKNRAQSYEPPHMKNEE